MDLYLFRALKHRNFKLHFTGQAISLIGTWMQRIALSWLIYEMTESALMLGIVSFFSLIPSLILTPFVGSWVDKFDKYKILFFAQSGLTLQAGLLALVVGLQIHTIPIILVLSLMQGLFNAVEVTARQSFIVELLDDRKDLPNAIALNSTAFNSARMIGPAIGGILLSTYGEFVCFLINFLSYFAVLWTLKKIKVKPSIGKAVKESTWKGLKDGFKYLKRSPHLYTLILIIATSSLFVVPYTTLLPIVSKEIFNGNAKTFSWFESMAGIGALVGAIYMARLKAGTNLRFRVIAGSAMMGLGLIILSLATSLFWGLLSVFLTTMGMMIQNSSINTYIQTHSMPYYRARIISYYIMAFQGIFPIGNLIMGAIGEYLPIQATLLIQGSIACLLCLIFSLYIRIHIIKR